MRVQFRVGPGVRCDLVAYAARNLSGKRTAVQFYPTGSQRGGLESTEVSSVVIRALPGTRVIFAASAEPTWEQAAWRAIRVTREHSMPSQQRNGLPGIRVPDLDLLDAVDAKKTDPDFESSYAFVDRLGEGTGWTFGRGGGLKGRVAMIRLERETGAGRRLTPEEAVARAVIERLRVEHPAAVDAAVAASLEALAMSSEDAVASFEAWLAG